MKRRYGCSKLQCKRAGFSGQVLWIRYDLRVRSPQFRQLFKDLALALNNAVRCYRFANRLQTIATKVKPFDMNILRLLFLGGIMEVQIVIGQKH